MKEERKKERKHDILNKRILYNNIKRQAKL